MDISTTQELGAQNEVNLCDSCCKEQPDCMDEGSVIYGTGKGLDNVCACSNYEPIELRHPRHNGSGQI